MQEEIKYLESELGLLLDQENLRWKQREKKNWYKMGDMDTKFFSRVCLHGKKEELH